MRESVEKIQISLRAPAATIEAFDAIAEALDRDRTWVMLQAFSSYLKAEGGVILQEAKGIAELDRGESVDFDEAMEAIDEIISDAEARAAVAERSA